MPDFLARPRFSGQNIPNELEAAMRASGVGFVVHGGTAGTARPAGYGIVIWFGTVQPTNAATNDLFINIS